MATQAQIDANRRNAQHSTGPRTPEGKRTVARNATTHGLFCQHLILPGENDAELESLRAGIHRRLRPADDLEMIYAERIVVAAWKMRRLIASERRLFDSYQRHHSSFGTAEELLTHQYPAEDVERIQKLTAALERSMDKAMTELIKLQKNRPDDLDDDDEIKPNSNDRSQQIEESNPIPDASDPQTPVSERSEEPDSSPQPTETCPTESFPEQYRT